ncbi:hypothetical protein CDAR_203451 [Caerostris darwini]|uniref:Uncharacterized protein n=1 Tax=Caerostris darwini TaxID=1538125 RepID=A0AAV4Q7N3_9ARAC|nr:hypothetical protein CDAR_203171 [Caerostris darwini]GIY05332.1 hypothetical protein CDAR_203451 [Caerostris darwini]
MASRLLKRCKHKSFFTETRQKNIYTAGSMMLLQSLCNSGLRSAMSSTHAVQCTIVQSRSSTSPHMVTGFAFDHNCSLHNRPRVETKRWLSSFDWARLV